MISAGAGLWLVNVKVQAEIVQDTDHKGRFEVSGLLQLRVCF